jgi:hypothetical protein
MTGSKYKPSLMGGLNCLSRQGDTVMTMGPQYWWYTTQSFWGSPDCPGAADSSDDISDFCSAMPPNYCINTGPFASMMFTGQSGPYYDDQCTGHP